MLLSDTWQPAVLQLLPFSSNDACNPQPASSRLRSLPTPDHSRGFPVLAVTRRDKEGGASDTFGGRAQGTSGAGPSHSMRARAASEKLTRSRTLMDPASILPPTSRARSEYHNRRSGTAATANAAGHTSRSSGKFSCSFGGVVACVV